MSRYKANLEVMTFARSSCVNVDVTADIALMSKRENKDKNQRLHAFKDRVWSIVWETVTLRDNQLAVI